MTIKVKGLMTHYSSLIEAAEAEGIVSFAAVFLL